MKPLSPLAPWARPITWLLASLVFTSCFARVQAQDVAPAGLLTADAALPHDVGLPVDGTMPIGDAPPQDPSLQDVPAAEASRPAFGYPMIDRILVSKQERRLYLLKQGEVVRSYRIALGLNPLGHKQQEGDFRTPEGTYRLIRRNARSDYFLSMEVSYPNEDDVARALDAGVSPGGAIMIHGLPNTPSRSIDYYKRTDWTDGCIAVSNSDMVEIWMMTPPNTPIEIRP